MRQNKADDWLKLKANPLGGSEVARVRSWGADFGGGPAGGGERRAGSRGPRLNPDKKPVLPPASHRPDRDTADPGSTLVSGVWLCPNHRCDRASASRISLATGDGFPGNQTHWPATEV